MLTGHTRYRENFRKQVVLQVEEEVPMQGGRRLSILKRKKWMVWRDATVDDLVELERIKETAPKPIVRRYQEVTLTLVK